MNRPTGLPSQVSGLDRPVVFGVLNVTPDSFSDGGRFLDPNTAIAHGLALVAQGADIVDVGGESTRPGAAPISAREEQDRVLEVVRALAAEGVAVSIDTMHASTAQMAVAAGACVVNDVSGGRADERMYATVAALGVPVVLMHWRGFDVREHTSYHDPIAEIRTEFLRACDHAIAAGVDPAAIIMDPGVGFAKDAETNWTVLRNLVEISSGYPILIGVSRKRFLGELLADPEPRPATERDVATHAISALLDGVWGIRVHDVRGTCDALHVARALKGATHG